MNRIYSIWFHFLGISEVKKKLLYQYCGSCKKIFEEEKGLYHKLGLTDSQVNTICEAKKDIESFKRHIEKMDQLNIEFVSIEDNEYPYLLREIPDPPIGFFVYGNKDVLKKPKISIIGGRKCSEYGFEITKSLSYQLSQKGFTIVSGMALGVDGAAHSGALIEGDTIAVLGTGVDICYPKQNYGIYREIIDKGCLVSEYFIGQGARPYHFPKRNRIISGMSVGTVVIEAAKKSGSLITADLALEQDRTVFAVPGNATSALSEGSNNLIKQGAKLVTNAQDIIEEIPLFIQQQLMSNESFSNKRGIGTLDNIEKIVYDELSWQPQTIDELTLNLNQYDNQIKTILLKLEIKGLAQRLPAGRYVKMK